MAFAEDMGRGVRGTVSGMARRDETGSARSQALDAAAGGENFPVASRLLAPRVRRQVVAFYNYARAADDAADDPHRHPSERVSALLALEFGLDGAIGDPRGTVLRDAVGPGPALDAARALMPAFHRDAKGIECSDWDDLMSYCSASAVPVGRFLLAVHSEDPAAHAPSDALCRALQVLNHVQDIAKDRRDLGRRYLPGDWMTAERATDAELTAPALAPALRRVVNRMLDGCDDLIEEAAELPRRIASRGLRAQATATLALARRLAARLRVQDPLAGRVSLDRPDMLRAGLSGLWAAL